jgi:alpha-glucosidase (family GH31 glycosyl hydrolase)
MVGDYIMMAPLYDKKARDIILPEGKWYYYFDGKEYKGKSVLKNFSYKLDEYPIFIKAGAIIPKMHPMKYLFEKAVDEIILDIYPHGSSSFELYQDDGETMDYLNGCYLLTNIKCEKSENQIVITFADSGTYKSAVNAYVLNVNCSEAEKVLLDKKELVKLKTKDELKKNISGWGYFEDKTSGKEKLFVKFPNQKSNTIIICSK